MNGPAIHPVPPSAGDDPLSPVQPGDVIRGKYRVERLLGQGGMAYVVSAWHLHLEQRVAIKLLRPETVEIREVVERFLREARAASRLEHPHVARVLDVDVLDTGAPFIVMEYLDGKDLLQMLHDHGPLPTEAVSRWIAEACSAIAEAHAAGIIHRDLKPANLFLAQRPRGEPVVKVLDFGISKLLQDTRITQTEVGMGSAEYMSPEQMRSAADVDGRTDLWSLGVTLYELTTGVTPFHADSVGQVAAALLTRDPTPPRRLRPDIPAGLEAVILRCLEKDPDRRFADAAALAAALAPFTAAAGASPWAAAPPPPLPPARASIPSVSGGLRSPPAPTVAEAPGGRASLPPGLPPPAPSPARGSPLGVAAGVGVALLAVAVVVAAFVLGRGRGPEPRDPAISKGASIEGRFTLDGAFLHDHKTMLAWQRAPAPGAMDWASAKEHCARQHGGLRLPEIEELSSLVAFTSIRPPLDAASFPTTAVDVFWSATPAGPGAASVVHFSDGRRGTSVVSERNRVRCVR